MSHQSHEPLLRGTQPSPSALSQATTRTNTTVNTTTPLVRAQRNPHRQGDSEQARRSRRDTLQSDEGASHPATESYAESPSFTNFSFVSDVDTVPREEEPHRPVEEDVPPFLPQSEEGAAALSFLPTFLQDHRPEAYKIALPGAQAEEIKDGPETHVFDRSMTPVGREAAAYFATLPEERDMREKKEKHHASDEESPRRSEGVVGRWLPFAGFGASVEHDGRGQRTTELSARQTPTMITTTEPHVVYQTGFSPVPPFSAHTLSTRNNESPTLAPPAVFSPVTEGAFDDEDEAARARRETEASVMSPYGSRPNSSQEDLLPKTEPDAHHVVRRHQQHERERSYSFSPVSVGLEVASPQMSPLHEGDARPARKAPTPDQFDQSLASRPTSAEDLPFPNGVEVNPTGTITSSLINLCNTILGAGMLTLPSAIASVGLLPGIGLILLSAMAAMFGLYLLSEAARYVGRSSSFFALCRATYPNTRAPAIIFDLAIALKCFGVSISYLILIGDNMHEVMLNFGYNPESAVTKSTFWITVFMSVIVPLAFLKKLDSMKYTSFLALTAVVYLVVITIFAALSPFEGRHDPSPWVYGQAQISGIAKLPIFIFAYTCHQNIFSVFNELKDNSRKPMLTTITLAVAISTVVYQIVGVLGYLLFGHLVSKNFLNDLGSGTPLIICRLLLTILFIFSYSLQAHPARASINRVIQTLRRPASIPSPVAIPMDNTSYLGITTLLLICSFMLAILVGDVESVLGFVGSTASTSICYILPGLFYWRLKSGERWTRAKFFAVVLFVAGCILVPVTLTVKVLGIFKVF